MKSFILCAGQSNKLDNINKCLIKINGESLLDRTLRLTSNTDRAIVGFESDLRRPRIKMINPEANRCMVESLYSLRGMWSDTNQILLGDVYYSDEAVDIMKNNYCPDSMIFYFRKFGRKTSILALTFSARHTQHLLDAAEETIQHFVMKDGEVGGKLNDLYNNVRKRDTTMKFISLDDMTRDFDTLGHLNEWREKYGVSG